MYSERITRERFSVIARIGPSLNLAVIRLMIVGIFLMVSGAALSSCAEIPTGSIEPAHESSTAPSSVPPYRGWTFLVERLRSKGVPEERLTSVFNDPRMPEFSLITFKLQPVEPPAIYQKYRSLKMLNEGRAFLAKYHSSFEQLSRFSSVNPEIVTAILLVETHFGQNTGREGIFNRLARVSSVGEPSTLAQNFELIRRDYPSVTMDQVRKRALYLEETFLPELIALFAIAERDKTDILGIKGSFAGAFGIPQFLPSSYIAYAVDGDGDGSISLYNIYDAIFSTANFLTHYGWKRGLTENQKRAVVWNYNHSQAYVDTIFWLAAGMAHHRM